MAVAGVPVDGVSPVVLSWETVGWIKERGSHGDLVIFRSQSNDDLNRKDLLANRDVVAPVLRHMGNLVNRAQKFFVILWRIH